MADYHATWPTVIDPEQTIKTEYRIVGRPHSWFIDREGILRSQQIGEMSDADFERQFAQIDR